MKANRLFITLFIFLMTSVSFAQKLKPSLHFSHLAKSIEKERFALNVNQIRYLENDTVEEQYTLVIDGNKKTLFSALHKPIIKSFKWSIKNITLSST